MDSFEVENIYFEMEKEVENVLQKVTNINTNNEKTQSTKNTLEDFATKSKEKITEEINSLKENSEWNTFTVAFYGETNAGKSTIIESLRILLNEKTKREEIEQFELIERINNVLIKELEDIDRECEEYKKKIEEFDVRVENIWDNYFLNKSATESSISNLQRVIEDKKNEFGIFAKLFYALGFKKIEEEWQVKKLKKSINNMELDAKKAVKNEEDRKSKNINHLEKLKEKYTEKEQEIEKNNNKLLYMQDGKIIGDGRHDFTKDNHIYEFDYNNINFNLIDVPGIEGDEQEVKDSILEAVKKAHAVFYVTSKPARPQDGDGKGREGTLQKIKKHLNAQTEVWSIFNKRINNSGQLNMPLINAGEKESLNEMDEAMKSVFGNKYKGHISLSALVSFLSLAECLVKDSDNERKKQKFISILSSEELLKFSKIEKIQRVVEEGAKDAPNKIRCSNLNKAACVLKDMVNEIKLILKEKIEPTLIALEDETETAIKTIDIAFNSLERNMKKDASKCVETFKDCVRTKTYEYIETDVGNKEFGARFEKYVEDEKPVLISNAEESMKKDGKSFCLEVEKIVEDMQERLSEFMEFSLKQENVESDFNFDLNINIKEDWHIGSILGTLGSIVVSIITFPIGGWVFFASLASAIIAGLKTVWGFFDHSYRRSQQRKATDEKLDEIGKKAKNEIEKVIEDKIIPEIVPLLNKVKEDIKEPVRQHEMMKNMITKVSKNLYSLSKNYSLD